MRISGLPKEVIEMGWKHGLAGRRVYFPKQTKEQSQESQTMVSSHALMLVREVESTYEDRGVTFYTEASPRKVFSGMFNKNRIGSKFSLKPRTAARVSSAAWRAWREWFGRKERLQLEQLRTIASENEREYGPLFLSYLEIRQQLRQGQTINVGYYTGYHSLPEEVIQEIVALAKSSVESCPWRSS